MRHLPAVSVHYLTIHSAYIAVDVVVSYSVIAIEVPVQIGAPSNFVLVSRAHGERSDAWDDGRELN